AVRRHRLAFGRAPRREGLWIPRQDDDLLAFVIGKFVCLAIAAFQRKVRRCVAFLQWFGLRSSHPKYCKYCHSHDEFHTTRNRTKPKRIRKAFVSYEIIRLRNGASSLRSLAYGETMHPAIGPLAEAEALYVQQLRIAERAAKHNGPFVVWDVGLGAAANAIAVLQALAPFNTQLTLLSFDAT